MNFLQWFNENNSLPVVCNKDQAIELLRQGWALHYNKKLGIATLYSPDGRPQFVRSNLPESLEKQGVIFQSEDAKKIIQQKKFSTATAEDPDSKYYLMTVSR